MEEPKNKESIFKKVWPLLVSASGGALMILAFFIPAIQDQWDRYQARQIIQEYIAIGEDFMEEQNYELAEEAFRKAYELSEEKRLDIEVMRLKAKINFIYQDPIWGSEPPEELEEVDFEFLLHFLKGPEHVKERASILTSYGVFLASIDKPKEAQTAIEEAIRLNSQDVLAYVNLGNLMDQVGKMVQAEQAYLKAISVDSAYAFAYYNLGLLYDEEGKLIQAEKEFAKAVKLDPADSDAFAQHRSSLMKLRRR